MRTAISWALALVCCAGAQAQGVSVKALPDPGKSTWSVQNCQAAGDCQVDVKPAVSGGRCTLAVDHDIVEFRRNALRPLSWKLAPNAVLAAAFDFRFKGLPGGRGVHILDNRRKQLANPADDEAETDFDVDTAANPDRDDQVFRKAAARATGLQRLYVYNIHVEFKPKASANWQDCDRLGPIIANRD